MSTFGLENKKAACAWRAEIEYHANKTLVDLGVVYGEGGAWEWGLWKARSLRSAEIENHAEHNFS